MPYTKEQLQRTLQWLTQRLPKLIEQGVRCAARLLPVLAVACRTCGHIMLFNEGSIFGSPSVR